MISILSGLQEWLPKIADTLWSWGPSFLGGIPLLVILLLGTGILLTIFTGGVQFRKFGQAFKLLLAGAMGKDGSDKDKGDISPFQALMTSLSATVGNGNIAGVATAIAIGGPGAVFWMWLTALFGMATKYSEAVLGVKFRVTSDDGSMSGGPMYYCERGVGGKFGKALGVFFAAACIVACLIGTGNMFQSNSMAVSVVASLKSFDLISETTNTTLIQGIVGLVLAVLVGSVILGGVKRIAGVAEKLVPTMIGFYFLAAIFIILWNITAIPDAFVTIFHSAFTPKGALGGAVGIGIIQAIRSGVARGLLSNESGLGSAPIAHGAAKTKSPAQQGQVAMMGTFIDTLVVCTLTALCITVTGAYLRGPLFAEEVSIGGEMVQRLADGTVPLQSIDMTMYAFDQVIPSGNVLIMIASFLFGFSTLLGWCYYGEKCTEYLFGTSKIKTGYRILFIVFLFIGSLPSAEGIATVAKVGDIGNALMALPNLIALILLAKEVGRITREKFAS